MLHYSVYHPFDHNRPGKSTYKMDVQVTRESRNSGHGGLVAMLQDCNFIIYTMQSAEYRVLHSDTIGRFY